MKERERERMVSGNEVFVRCNGLGYKKSWGIEGAWTRWKYKLEISKKFCKLLRQMVRHPGQCLIPAHTSYLPVHTSQPAPDFISSPFFFIYLCHFFKITEMGPIFKNYKLRINSVSCKFFVMLR